MLSFFQEVGVVVEEEEEEEGHLILLKEGHL